MCRVRSPWLGAEHQDSFLTAQFNVHRIQQHKLVRDGATFRSIESDLLTTGDYDTHFTDVLEDAGSAACWSWTWGRGLPTAVRMLCSPSPKVLGAILPSAAQRSAAGGRPVGAKT